MLSEDELAAQHAVIMIAFLTYMVGPTGPQSRADSFFNSYQLKLFYTLYVGIPEHAVSTRSSSSDVC